MLSAARCRPAAAKRARSVVGASTCRIHIELPAEEGDRRRSHHRGSGQRCGGTGAGHSDGEQRPDGTSGAIRLPEGRVAAGLVALIVPSATSTLAGSAHAPTVVCCCWRGTRTGASRLFVRFGTRIRAGEPAQLRGSTCTRPRPALHRGRRLRAARDSIATPIGSTQRGQRGPGSTTICHRTRDPALRVARPGKTGAVAEAVRSPRAVAATVAYRLLALPSPGGPLLPPLRVTLLRLSAQGAVSAAARLLPERCTLRGSGARFYACRVLARGTIPALSPAITWPKLRMCPLPQHPGPWFVGTSPPRWRGGVARRLGLSDGSAAATLRRHRGCLRSRAAPSAPVSRPGWAFSGRGMLG